MKSAEAELGRVLVRGRRSTRTRPSFRPPPDPGLNFLSTKGRHAALRRFGDHENLKNLKGVPTMAAGQ
jgi:hypothetical protein